MATKFGVCIAAILAIITVVQVEASNYGGIPSDVFQSRQPSTPFNCKISIADFILNNAPPFRPVGRPPFRPVGRGGVRPQTGTKDARRPQSVITLGILLFNNVEVLDVAGPFEVFSITGERGNGSLKVLMIGDQKVMSARNGLNIVPDYLYTDPNLPKLDVLVVPGSTRQPTLDVLNNEPLLNWIRKVEPKLKYLLSVCTGASVIAKLGFVDGLKVTTHHWAFDLLSEYGPRVIQRRGCRYTDNGRILTSAGISAGIDLSLYFVSKIFDKDQAIGVQEQMEYIYPWDQIDRTCIS